jgi:ATP-dependent Clp endopeptidase proteolytic subunit ClpP
LKYILDIAPQIKMTDELIHKTWKLPVSVDFHGSVNEKSAKQFIEDFKAAENAAINSGQEIIPVTINSFGGCVYSLLGMVDVIKSSKKTVATIVESKAMSAGAVLLSCGTEGHRYIAPNATVMIHTVSSGSPHAKTEEIKANSEETNRLAEMLFKLLAKNCGKNEDYFKDIVQKQKVNADWYMTADEALKHNLANHIGVPTMKVDVTMNTKFGLDID